MFPHDLVRPPADMTWGRHAYSTVSRLHADGDLTATIFAVEKRVDRNILGGARGHRLRWPVVGLHDGHPPPSERGAPTPMQRSISTCRDTTKIAVSELCVIDCCHAAQR